MESGSNQAWLEVLDTPRRGRFAKPTRTGMLSYPPIKQMPSLGRVPTRFQLGSVTPRNRQYCPALGDWANEVRG